MSAESERIFGKPLDEYQGDGEIEFVKRASVEAQDVFRRTMLFLEDPGVLPHDKMQELAAISLVKLDDETAEVIVHPQAELENAPIDTFSEGYARILVPGDYMRIAKKNPTEILLHGVRAASFMRDLTAGWNEDYDLAGSRATIFQSEFLLWWERVAPQLGITYDLAQEHERILDIFPQGMDSPLAEAFYVTLTSIINPSRTTLSPFVGPMPGFDLLATPNPN